ncbi:MAG: hypothetical protein MJ237_09210 [bacterium]|nr:hypothetical protein [bacterium]
MRNYMVKNKFYIDTCDEGVVKERDGRIKMFDDYDEALDYAIFEQLHCYKIHPETDLDK